jgi:hypothetical protein
MLNLDTLDTIIAVVVVLLILSLIVQSIQSFVKKLFKLKSGTLLSSLEDLFNYIDISGTGKTAKQLVDEVTGELKKIGRISVFGNLMVDSIAKGDLEKILTKLGYDKLLTDVTVWFDSVMQSFEERYTRHMKTVALVLSFVVVIFLNANFFSIYQKISTDGVLKAALVERGAELQKRREQQASLPADTPGAMNSKAQLKAEYDAFQKELQENVGAYKSVGFSPLTLQQVKDFCNGAGGWQGTNRFKEGTKVVAGWSLMALLLSVGAPFWQDALESLFGIKNLLRKQSDTKNVEGDKGGQPNP